MNKKSVYTEKAPAAVGPYSQGILAGNLFFTSGQIPLDPATGQIVDEDIKVQTKQVMENLRAVLEAAGADFSSVIKTVIFLTDMNQFAAVNEVYGGYFSSEPPARSTVQVQTLPKGARVEIEMVALVE